MKPHLKIYTFISLMLCLLSAESQTLNLPARSPSAMTGDQFVAYITSMSLTNRENAIYDEVMAGNVPDFIRTLKPVNSSAVISSTTYTATYYVIPDYLAIGCDTDYFLCPMTPLLAQRIADQIGCTLPTRKMVNDIWTAATVHLSPSTIPPSAEMVTVPVFATHDSTVWVQRNAVIAAHPLGELVGGDKKDVVISNIIYGYPSPGRVVIYGWHYTSGTPIQPLYNGHEETYADYSHGIRMVQLACTLNGNATDINSILTSSTYNTVLSDEGVITTPRYPVSLPLPSVPKSFCVLNEGISQARIILNDDSDNSGYIVQKSSDGLNFSNCTSSTDTNFIVNGLTNEAITYFRIAAYNSIDTTTWSEVLAVTPSSFNEHVLIVNGFDRTSTGNTYNFIRQHGTSVFQAGYLFSSATNDAVLNGLIDLNNFSITDWILGDESTADECFSNSEQNLVSTYLKQGGKLFVSGSEVAWDLDYKGSATDKDFYHNFLKASYVNDAPNGTASTYYSASSISSQFFSSLSDFSFDNGTHGTFNVKYPDVINEINGSANCFYYSSLPTNYAGICFTGIFPNGSDTGKLVNMGIPFETIYPDSSRNNLMGKILEYFNPIQSLNIIASNGTSLCEGDTTVLSVLQDYGHSFQWMRDDQILPGDSLTSLSVSQSGEYTCLISLNNQTDTSSLITIVVHPKPTAQISTAGSSSFCSGDSAILTADFNSNYTYQWLLNGSVINGATNSTFVAISEGDYNVMVSENICSAVSDTLNIAIWPLPTAYAGNDTAVCLGSSVILSATGGCNYVWDNDVNQNITFQPDTTLTYHVTVTNVFGCSSTDSVILEVVPLPPAPTITQYNHYLLSSQAYSYQWYYNDDILPTDTLQLLVPANNGWYHVVACDSLGCCSTSASYYYLFTNMNEISNDTFACYLSDEYLYLYIHDGEKCNIDLCSVDGNILFKKEINSQNQIKFNIGNLSTGIYILRVQDLRSSKIIKLFIY